MAFDYTTIAFLLLCMSVTINAMFSFWTHLRVMRMESYVARQCSANAPIPAMSISPDDIKHLQVNFANLRMNPEVPLVPVTEEDDRLSLDDSTDASSDASSVHSDELEAELEHELEAELKTQIEAVVEQITVQTPSATSSVSQELSVPEIVEPSEELHTEVDYKKMNVASLKDLCESRGISFSKKDRKDDLIGHLKHWDENQ
jgi:hypothetical protein